MAVPSANTPIHFQSNGLQNPNSRCLHLLAKMSAFNEASIISTAFQASATLEIWWTGPNALSSAFRTNREFPPVQRLGRFFLGSFYLQHSRPALKPNTSEPSKFSNFWNFRAGYFHTRVCGYLAGWRPGEVWNRCWRVGTTVPRGPDLGQWDIIRSSLSALKYASLLTARNEIKTRVKPIRSNFKRVPISDIGEHGRWKDGSWSLCEYLRPSSWKVETESRIRWLIIRRLDEYNTIIELSLSFRDKYIWWSK